LIPRLFQLNFELIAKAPLIGAFLFVGLFPDSVQAQCETSHYDESAWLGRVSDGDTLRLRDGRKIRLIGLNTPELARKGRPEQALAQEAKQMLKKMFHTSQRVHLKYGTQRKDRYKRVLAHVFTKTGRNVTAELIAKGLGFAIVVPPNDWQSDCYFRLERQAIKQAKGIWAQPDYKVKLAHELSRKMTGFQRIQGRVSKIGQAKKSLWLDLSPSFSVKVNRRSLKYFEKRPIENLVGVQIRVRGWVAYYNGKLRMSLRHPAMMEIVDDQ